MGARDRETETETETETERERETERGREREGERGREGERERERERQRDRERHREREGGRERAVRASNQCDRGFLKKKSLLLRGPTRRCAQTGVSCNCPVTGVSCQACRPHMFSKSPLCACPKLATPSASCRTHRCVATGAVVTSVYTPYARPRARGAPRTRQNVGEGEREREVACVATVSAGMPVVCI